MAGLKQRLAVILLVVLLVAVDFVSKVLSFFFDGIFAAVLIAVLWPWLFGKKQQ